MCGIVGCWSPGQSESARHDAVRRMASCLEHRGPDADGVWVDDASGIALAHRRLAIVDLTPSGAQPMASESGRYVIVLNGEIYNYRVLRDELAQLGHRFRGSSDTEVLLAGFEQWGVRGAIERAAGMFAIAVWDRTERVLRLVRDRLGEKPLYFGWSGDSLLFGSELKALRAHPRWQGTIDRSALAEFLRFTYVPAPLSIYEGIEKLEPGTIAAFHLETGRRESIREPYWSAAEVLSAGASNRLDASDQELVEALDLVLRRTIEEEMVADVPLGAFLSGGLDSSLVVALMQACSARPVRTFSIGFTMPDYNEAPYAKRVAQHLGTDHTEYYVTPQDAMSVIERLPRIYDEPFADSSQIPTFLVSRMARKHVTVALSGDGGDEVFGGYNRYLWTERIWARTRTIPLPARRMMSRALLALSPESLDSIGRGLGRIVPSLRMRAPGDKAHKLARLLTLASREGFYREQISSWSDPATVLVGWKSPNDETESVSFRTDTSLSFIEQMMLHDLLGYLPGDILAKVDRAAMAVSLETRAPFLDHRVLEFASRLPFDLKLRKGRSKWILRQLLQRYVPDELMERPKMGFAVPLHAWLRGDLRDWAAHLLEPARLQSEGFFDVAAVQRIWMLHQSGRVNATTLLWPLLMFQAWLPEQRTAERAAA